MAEHSGISVQTLRDYDKEKLLVPQVVDGVTGDRSYAPAQLVEAQIIRTLKEYGFTVKEIRELFKDRRPEKIRTALKRRQRILEEEQLRLFRKRRPECPAFGPGNPPDPEGGRPGGKDDPPFTAVAERGLSPALPKPSPRGTLGLRNLFKKTSDPGGTLRYHLL